MDYDPVKDRLVRFFETSVFGHRLFFAILHLVFLRSWYVRRALARILDATPDARVLDAGTGFGQYTDWMIRRYPKCHITAVDIKRDYLSRLSGYLAAAGLQDRVDVRYGDLVHLEETGPFDLVLSVDVMEHILEDVQVFTHFRRVLAPSGRLIVNTPSDQGGSNVQSDGEASFIGEHVRDGYGVAEIAEKLSRAGLADEVIEFGYGKAGSLGWRLLVHVPMQLLGRSMLFLPIVAVYYLVGMPLGLLLNGADMATTNPIGTGLTVVAKKA
ncbi:MAG: 2-polyprenyl-3-methyl-5-hydroxy-6-metoxy-1,4-benzoquinol methylase [Rhodothermales bacterium]|jgi:2-polyprenyl-3-methyl-5-hydroxy-6-metoxy-1,4-benzoquinol methylase